MSGKDPSFSCCLLHNSFIPRCLLLTSFWHLQRQEKKLFPISPPIPICSRVPSKGCTSPSAAIARRDWCGHRRRSRQSLWQSYLMPISSSTRAGQWQLSSGFVAGAAAPVVSISLMGNRSSLPLLGPSRIPAAALKGWGQ